jgi:hypothetical protein
LIRKSTETKSMMATVASILDELIIERNLPLVIPNKPQKNWMNRPRRLSSNRRKPNPRWWPSWMSGGADHRKEPSSSHPQ